MARLRAKGHPSGTWHLDVHLVGEADNEKYAVRHVDLPRSRAETDPVVEQDLRCEVLRPSELGPHEVAVWRQMLAQSRWLQRAFFSPTLALACERAFNRVHVAVVHEGSNIQAFLPFQFHSAWHQRLRLAERIGGNLSDAAGVIGWPDLWIDSERLMRLTGLATLFLTHLVEEQAQFGLDAVWSDKGYVTDIADGPDDYFATLAETNRSLLRDTERRLRRAEMKYGSLRYGRFERIPPQMIANVIRQKRLQYERSHVADPLARSANRRLIEAKHLRRTAG